MIGLNCGSGQRPFDRAAGWVNIDISPRWNPDIVGDWNDLSMFDTGTVDLVVSSHSMEHLQCGEADGCIREAYRVLRPGGSLIITLPDIKALAQRWLLGQISDYIYIVNLMGAFMGDPADTHKWHLTRETLVELLNNNGQWRSMQPFDWRGIPGMDLARDWWVLSIEAVK